MIMAPRSSSGRLALSAAGFKATSTFGLSPGVRMSREAKWIWKAATPADGTASPRPAAGIGRPATGGRSPPAHPREACVPRGRNASAVARCLDPYVVYGLGALGSGLLLIGDLGALGERAMAVGVDA